MCSLRASSVPRTAESTVKLSSCLANLVRKFQGDVEKVLGRCGLSLVQMCTEISDRCGQSLGQMWRESQENKVSSRVDLAALEWVAVRQGVLQPLQPTVSACLCMLASCVHACVHDACMMHACVCACICEVRCLACSIQAEKLN